MIRDRWIIAWSAEPRARAGCGGYVCSTRDCDGTAKIATISIERSISAWSILREHYPTDRDGIMKMLAQLARLRTMLTSTFPRARDFYRPGFDD